MRKLTLSFISCVCILSACKNTPANTTEQPAEESSSYRYIEIVQEQRFLGNPGPERQLEAISIEAENDTLAYIEAFKLFIQANKKNVDAIESDAAQFDTPIDFKLLDASGNDIAKTTAFKTKEKVENEIFDQYFKIE